MSEASGEVAPYPPLPETKDTMQTHSWCRGAPVVQLVDLAKAVGGLADLLQDDLSGESVSD